MEALLGVSVGGIISIIAAWLTSRWAFRREELAEIRNQRQLQVKELQALYELALSTFAKLGGFSSENEDLQNLAWSAVKETGPILVRLRLSATSEIVSLAENVVGLQMQKTTPDSVIAELGDVVSIQKAQTDRWQAVMDYLEMYKQLTQLMREHIESLRTIRM